MSQFYPDVQQMTLGSCKLEDIAGRVATRVTGHYPHNNQILIDAGFLATSHDGPKKLPNGGSYCLIENEPYLK
jgi:D-serine deaminase-like pyridoxal phosphate-dependent protein